MAQKDNALNMQTAEASLNLSRASFRDSAAMIAIAEDSKQVALATSKDSSSMFIISALTLAFLPPTYTAVSYYYPLLLAIVNRPDTVQHSVLRSQFRDRGQHDFIAFLAVLGGDNTIDHDHYRLCKNLLLFKR